MEKVEIEHWLSRAPFEPFRIYRADGRRFDVPFADVARVLSHEVLVFIGMKEGTRQAKGYSAFPFDHVDRIEPLGSATRRKRAS